MKRNLVLVLAALVAMAVASASEAATRSNDDGPHPGTMEVNLGFAKSSDDAIGNGDTMNGGLALGVAYWLHPSPSVTWGPEVSFDGMGSVEYDNGLTANNEGSIHLVRVHPTIRYNFSKGIGTRFFGQAGAGLYSVTAKVDDSMFGTLQSTDSKFGFNLGAGIDFPVGAKSRMNVTALYHNVSMDPESLNYGQIRAGIGFNL